MVRYIFILFITHTKKANHQNMYDIPFVTKMFMVIITAAESKKKLIELKIRNKRRS